MPASEGVRLPGQVRSGHVRSRQVTSGHVRSRHGSHSQTARYAVPHLSVAISVAEIALTHSFGGGPWSGSPAAHGRNVAVAPFWVSNVPVTALSSRPIQKRRPGRGRGQGHELGGVVGHREVR
jgi:hypothetical protein